MPDVIHPETGEVLGPGVAWPTGKPHVSFSELSDWIECPFRHKLAHIDRLGTFVPTPHLGFGQAVHSCNESYVMTRRMDPAPAIKQVREDWEANSGLFLQGPFPSWARTGFGTVDDWVRKVETVTADVPAFLDRMFPSWEAHSAEETLYEPIEGHPIRFKGYIDAVLKVPDKRGKTHYVIIDWKTCGWGWRLEKQQDFNVQLQLVLYKAFWARKHGIPPRDIRCAFALLKRDGKPGASVSLVPVGVGPSAIDQGLRVIDNHIRSVGRGFFPKNRDSCRFCEFDGTPHCPTTL